MRRPPLFLLLTTLAATAMAATTFIPARPPAVPLAVRSPYLNVWLQASDDPDNNGPTLPGSWPRFWTYVPPPSSPNKPPPPLTML